MNRKALLQSVVAVFVALSLAPIAALADEKSEKAAADLLHKKLENESPSDKALLDAVKGKDIVVVRGSMDHIESVLATARIKHTVITPEQVAAYELKSSMILMVNCPGNMPEEGLKRIERFVRAGGLLYTTDWALMNVVQRAFPNTIAANGQGTGDEVVAVTVDKNDDNLMTKMLLRKEGQPQWWLEGGSYPIKVLDAKRVNVLASSAEMGKRYGSSAVVVRFRWEDGEVIHVVSHFYRQVATKGPAVAAASVKIDGLSEKQQKDFAASDSSKANIGDVESSYAFQRMTTNLVTGKQKRNTELDQMYNMTVRGDAAMRSAPGAGASAAPVATAQKGTRMKVIGKKGDQVQVRDEMGNEGWVPATEMIVK